MVKRGRRGGKRGKKKKEQEQAAPMVSWMAEEGMHALIAGEDPSAEELDVMTKAYQQKLRVSPIWDELVKAYGREGAERAIQQCKVELRKG